VTFVRTNVASHQFTAVGAVEVHDFFVTYTSGGVRRKFSWGGGFI